MKKRFMTVAALMFAMGCNLGSGSTVVYYPAHSSKTTTVSIEEPYHTEPEVVTVVETVTYTSCDPFFEEYESPYYHEPDFCTDYGAGVGYCCMWLYVDGYADCSSEWCFWEDTCSWDHVIDECAYDPDYYDYY